MVIVSFLTGQDIVNAKKRLLVLHKVFENQQEQDAVADFANCLKTRLRPGTALDFLTACEEAADDLLDNKKLPETYDRYTVGVMKDLAEFFAKELFGKTFSEEVRQFIDVRELV